MRRSSRSRDSRRRARILAALVAGAAVLWSAFPVDGRSPGDRRGLRDAAPLDLLNHALGQLVYDVYDDPSGTSSALRGHSLARSLYGANDQTLDVEPFNGTGRLHFEHPAGVLAPSAVDDERLVNYQRFDGDPVRDPERYGTRADTMAPRAYFTGGFNPSYTYPDANNMFLAAVRLDGRVVVPSFHRAWIFGPPDPSNPRWWTPEGKYQLLRPRPAEMGPGFPALTGFGDVKQLDGAPGGNDSIWMDLGYPVQIDPDGRKSKPLFAFLIVDLDGRIHLSTHGRLLDVGPRDSNQGWGPWEVGVKHVVTPELASGDRLRRPAIAPWLWDRASESFYRVAPDDPGAPPAGPAVPFPSLDRRGHPLGDPGEPVPASSDFRTPGHAANDPETDWRGTRSLALVAQALEDDPHGLGGGALEAALHGRLDLARDLTPYRRRGETGRESDADGLAAGRERQGFAEEIYRNLLLVTGVGPVPEDRMRDPRDEDLAPRRWLAQVAANIVDYIDEDEIATPFNFYSPDLDGLPPGRVGEGRPTTSDELLPRYWVFGTELPRVVLNEVMSEVQPVDPGDGAATVRVWAELFAPSRDVPSPDPQGAPRNAEAVPLFAKGGPSGGYSVYQIVIADAVPSDLGDNVLGAPDGVHAVVDFAPRLGILGNPRGSVPARIGADRFLVVGPESMGGQDAQRTLVPTRTRPASTRWHRSEGMEFGVACAPEDAGCVRPLTVVLRRLANPHLPPDPRPSTGGDVNPAYNPYVTIDYLEEVSLRDPSIDGTRASGKLQPYASHPRRVKVQTREQGGGTRHTLGEPNEPRQPPDWLVHLDRQPISPVELLQVSGFHPHRLTHRFITTPAGEAADYAHRAPWFDEDLVPQSAPRDGPSHRLSRLFEFVQVGREATHGSAVVNLNTIYDREAFFALLRSEAPDLDDDGLETLWRRFLELRSPGLLESPPSLTALDRPFQSPGVGHLPSSDPQSDGRGVGIEDTLFRAWDPESSNGARRLFDLPDASHPYDEKELLARLSDRIAVRSNVFAVWLTVGFFEVVDDQTTPPRLGPEIGGPNGMQRHRFFAIVDRSQLQLFGSGDRGGGSEAGRHLTRSDEHSGSVPHPGPHWVRLESIAGSTATERRDAAGGSTGEHLPWQIVPGAHLFVDEGADRERVLVTDVDPVGRAIRATFARRHAPGFGVSMPGNPGPQRSFDVRAPRYRDVIRLAVSLE